MSYLQLAYLHLATVLPAFLLGTYPLLIAGTLALMPGRMLHSWIFA